MTSKFYKCDQCECSFSRKWNALRHNELKHANSAHISNNRFKTDRFSYRAHSKYYDYQIKFNILNQDRSEANDDKLDKYFPDIFTLDFEDIKIIKIIDQLMKPFEKLEELLKHLDEHTRGIILLNSLNASLKTSSPVNSMNDTVELYHSMNGIKKIAYYMDVVNKESFNDSVSVIKEKSGIRIFLKEQIINSLLKMKKALLT